MGDFKPKLTVGGIIGIIIGCLILVCTVFTCCIACLVVRKIMVLRNKKIVTTLKQEDIHIETKLKKALVVEDITEMEDVSELGLK